MSSWIEENTCMLIIFQNIGLKKQLNQFNFVPFEYGNGLIACVYNMEVAQKLLFVFLFAWGDLEHDADGCISETNAI